jgi:methyl-accepting chemotaxis protein
VSLRNRFLLPVLVILLIVESVLGITSYQTQKQQLIELMKQETEAKTESIQQKLLNNEKTLNILTESLKNNYLRITNAVASIIAQNPNVLNPTDLQKITDKVGVGEISVISAEGKIAFSNEPKFVGFDFNSSEQTKPFLHMGPKGLAQDPVFRASDGTFYMYTGVNRFDQKGVVEIGIEPKEYIDTLNNLNPSSLLKDEKLNQTGYFLLLKGDQIVAFSSSISDIKTISDAPFLKSFVTADKHDWMIDKHGKAYVSSLQAGEYRIIGVAHAEDYTAPLQSYRNIILIVACLSLIGSFLIIWLLVNRLLILPLEYLKSLMFQVSKGNLQWVTIDLKRQDTIGDVNRGFVAMLNELRNIISKMNEMGKQVAHSTKELDTHIAETKNAANQATTVVAKMEDGMNVQMEGAEESMRAIKEMAASMQHISSSSQTVSEAITETEKEAQEGNEAIQKAIRQMGTIHTSVGNLASIVKNLAERSSAIENISAVITDIASQTHLLALNAAIEAARAGEHGKGFAIVADEVRKLAEQSRKSANEIVCLIQEIQHDTNETTEAMKIGTRDVREGITSVHEAGKSFQHILFSIQEVTSKIQEVYAASEQMTASSEEISASTTEMAHIAIESKHYSQQVAAAFNEQLEAIHHISASTDSLNRMVNELKNLVDEFDL